MVCFNISLLLKIRDLLLVLRRIEVEVLEKLLINEESIASNSYDRVSLQNVSTHRKRSNSVPENRIQQMSANSESKAKSVSTLSLTASANTPPGNQSNNFEDNLSVTSVESTTTTTASVDSFEIALGLSASLNYPFL